MKDFEILFFRNLFTCLGWKQLIQFTWGVPGGKKGDFEKDGTAKCTVEK